ncbi:IS110 family transposase [Bacillus sp. FSL K6-6540]|uniref:IS110 family transposase n=1 Tax=Bacillus sp. FSL K6-6540 TaxID=2921512 RepID=UPI0030F908CB
MLSRLQAETGLAPVVVLEATGHYHRALVSYLDRSGYTYYMVNPLQSKRAKRTQLRKVKTDALDDWHLAEMYYRGDVKRTERGMRRLRATAFDKAARVRHGNLCAGEAEQ